MNGKRIVSSITASTAALILFIIAVNNIQFSIEIGKFLVLGSCD
jgi:hypothetical protein